ncbi:D-alanyl-lipoteichoic acid acyltransferase DltB (MBOAT superfamily) [Fontibacillus phaseoli]|uniref:D-alanyl-lipoteichoic acid acyltransferase DltB (MBOAT superfamily) n=1 Tax=Fontibacillus phaseoli TaxID=1416533 RepID=A0A369B7U5_9BACL|nr:MBOAT family protein [Fontibacillus phaseoli]RCX16668.1 D-alanyl-lipoteichoic acid acyltransferase DltB (MBOAT superfamily) [Fontibacillus phaseoli]
MLFNSYEFIFAFWPVTFVVYFLLNRFCPPVIGKLWLAVASLFFYSWWSIKSLPLILASIAFNYIMGWAISHSAKSQSVRKLLLTLAITGDVLLLGYYKYADFLISNVNSLFSAQLHLLQLALPLGISFFTFTQIAYLVDAYRGKAKEYSIVNYVLFVTFYPHLIAGPILHHKEMMPQFDRARSKKIIPGNVARGLFVFCIGLFKKVVIADTLAPIATQGFDVSTHLSLIEGWTTSLAYTLQLYFDFSGYSDMAIGIALLFNIKLPINFNSPYKAVSIQDFWRRWHMTLSRFLKDYIYIPLGGNRKGHYRTYFNLVATFVIGGIWHGAGWTFIVWGLLHGVAQVIERLWKKTGIVLPRWVAWFITFMFINFSWVFFRAKTWDDAIKVFRGMFNFSEIGVSMSLLGQVLMIAVALIVAVFALNSMDMKKKFRPNLKYAAFIAFLFVFSVLYFNQVSEFLYFTF